ncbi:sigma-70 family RNA polymerase sigma factor [Chloroflexota bacterium]
MQDEESLVRRAQQKDQRAFTELYEAYFDKIYRYVVIKISDRMEAEDLTQQVFLKALESISSFKWKGVPFSAWLYRIAHNQVIDYYRRQEKRPNTLQDDAVVVSDNNPQQTAERNLDIEQVMSATRQLTEAQREVISLRFSGGMSTNEVASIMGKSQGAIKALQHSAIVALRKTLLVGTNE